MKVKSSLRPAAVIRSSTDAGSETVLCSSSNCRCWSLEMKLYVWRPSAPRDLCWWWETNLALYQLHVPHSTHSTSSYFAGVRTQWLRLCCYSETTARHFTATHSWGRVSQPTDRPTAHSCLTSVNDADTTTRSITLDRIPGLQPPINLLWFISSLENTHTGSKNRVVTKQK